MKSELDRALLEAVEALDGLRLRYAVVGGLAVSTWTAPRATQDVDLYAELPDAARPALERALRERGFDVPAMEAELERFGVFRSRSHEGVFLDIFPAVGLLGEAVVQRRRKARIAGRALWVVAPEELAALKAFSDRPRDFLDLVKLVNRAKVEVDLRSIEQWARELDASIGTDEVSERVHRARSSRD
jgi:hypothetical protein